MQDGHHHRMIEQRVYDDPWLLEAEVIELDPERFANGTPAAVAPEQVAAAYRERPLGAVRRHEHVILSLRDIGDGASRFQVDRRRVLRRLAQRALEIRLAEMVVRCPAETVNYDIGAELADRGAVGAEE